VDAVITDPPYGIDFQSNMRDKRLPKIANDKRPFIWFLHDAYRVTKDGGCCICFCRWDTEDVFRMAMEAAGFRIKSQLVWDRVNHGMGDLRGAFAPRHDVMWFGTKGKFAFHDGRPASVIPARRVSGTHLVHPNEKPILDAGAHRADGATGWCRARPVHGQRSHPACRAVDWACSHRG
jgi:site-specific DNA-methyltransferase (adenine-specific)